MRNFCEELKNSIKQEILESEKKDEDIVQPKPVLPEFDPDTMNDCGHKDCIVFMKCKLFNDEEIAIVYGPARIKPHREDPGGRITIVETGRKTEFSGVIFSSKELDILFEDKYDEELLIHVYNIKKQFGSTSRIIQGKEDMEIIWNETK